MDVIKASSVQLIRQIEQGIQFGKWILVENVGTTLDPALEPIVNITSRSHSGSRSVISDQADTISLLSWKSGTENSKNK